jgi:hypothetical protein
VGIIWQIDGVIRSECEEWEFEEMGMWSDGIRAERHQLSTSKNSLESVETSRVRRIDGADKSNNEDNNSSCEESRDTMSRAEPLTSRNKRAR